MGRAWSGEGLPAYAYRFNQPANPDATESDLVLHAAEVPVQSRPFRSHTDVLPQNWWMFRGTNMGLDGTTTFTNMTASEEAFVEELIAYWLSFVRTHDPNTFKLERSPLWPQYTASSPNIIVLQRPTGADANSTTVSGSVIEKQDDAETRRCDFVARQEN